MFKHTAREHKRNFFVSIEIEWALRKNFLKVKRVWADSWRAGNKNLFAVKLKQRFERITEAIWKGTEEWAKIYRRIITKA